MQFLRRANDEHSNAPRWACPEQLSKSPGHVPTIQRHNRSASNKPRAHWLRAVSQLRFQAHRDAMVRFFMPLPLAFFAKTSRGLEITKVPFSQGFRARDGVGGRPVVSSLWPRFEPFRVALGANRVPWFV